MRVARTGETLEQRREVISELFDFIRDFNGLDTTLLQHKLLDDPKFLEAAEAVLQSAVGPWKSVDALRDFAVQALYGEKPADRALVDRARPGRVSPFSVPFALLRALLPGQFDARNLRSLSVAEALQCEGLAGEETRWEARMPSNEAWLVTTMWARTIPTKLRHSKVRVTNYNENRTLYEGRMWAMLDEPVPCFWWLSPSSPLEVMITRQRQEEPTEILIAIEGWRYTVR